MSWFDSSVEDAALNVIKTTSTAIHLLTTYTDGDPYATVIANSKGSVVVSSADMTLANGGTGARKLSTANKSITPSASIGQGASAFVAWVDATNSRVCAVAPCSINEAFSNGTPYPFVFGDITINQPT